MHGYTVRDVINLFINLDLLCHRESCSRDRVRWLHFPPHFAERTRPPPLAPDSPKRGRKEEKREEAGKEYEESCKRSSFLIIWAFEASLSDGGFVLQVEGCRKHNFK